MLTYSMWDHLLGQVYNQVLRLEIVVFSQLLIPSHREIENATLSFFVILGFHTLATLSSKVIVWSLV